MGKDKSSKTTATKTKNRCTNQGTQTTAQATTQTKLHQVGQKMDERSKRRSQWILQNDQEGPWQHLVDHLIDQLSAWTRHKKYLASISASIWTRIKDDN